ncbi:Hsp70 family protein [Lysobacter terrae]
MIVGIDLGTTNSLAAVWRDGKALLVPNALGTVLTPSCVGIDEDGTVLIGQAARERLQTHPEKTVALFKRHMGSAKVFKLGNRTFRAEELSSLVLRALKADAEALLGEPVDEAIITVPAYFSDAQRKATRVAGQLAGLKVERLINEPTAAALAYGLHQDEEATQFLVFDLGGGTFDVSILEMFEGVMEVRATAGDNFLGGEDFADAIVKRFLQDSGIPAAAAADASMMQILIARAEAAKRQLSQQASAEISVHWQGQDYRMALDQALLGQICEPMLARLRAPVERALRDARIANTDIDAVVLAGGATRMPLVRQLVTRMFGRFPNTELNPDEVIVVGAAVMAGLQAKDQALKEVVMTDVCPYTLGTDVIEKFDNGREVRGWFSPIIERNTVVPVSRVKSYVATKDFQSYMDIDIFQGEARLVKDNIKLGNLKVQLPHLPRHESAVDVRFTYDVNGLLEVEATVRKTGEKHRVVIQGNDGVMTDEQIQTRLAELAELKIHPRDKAVNRTLLAQAETLFQQLLGERREWMGRQIARFEEALESQEERTIAPASERLNEIIAHVERNDETFLGLFD